MKTKADRRSFLTRCFAAAGALPFAGVLGLGDETMINHPVNFAHETLELTLKETDELMALPIRPTCRDGTAGWYAEWLAEDHEGLYDGAEGNQ